jgi:riboflavin kinase/FMN adenylyltransferase
MQLMRQIGPDATKHARVAVIGGFDGLHLGHRALFDAMRVVARSSKMQSALVTFEPLPKEYFAPAQPPARLTTFRERWRLLERTGLDVFCALHFNDWLRSLAAEEFAALLRSGDVRHLIMGHDFRAGRNGEASAEWFQQHGPQHGIAVEVVAPVMVAGIRVSSSEIRSALVEGNLKLAQQLLGRPYSMRGRVVHGEQLGRQLGYPTANLRLGRRQTPMDGIFAVRVRGAGNAGGQNDALDGVASLGVRPTIGGTVPLLEAHLFDFSGDLYGREIEVEFVTRLRDELRFDTLDAMVVQMHRDAEAARAALAAG